MIMMKTCRAQISCCNSMLIALTAAEDNMLLVKGTMRLVQGTSAAQAPSRQHQEHP